MATSPNPTSIFICDLPAELYTEIISYAVLHPTSPSNAAGCHGAKTNWAVRKPTKDGALVALLCSLRAVSLKCNIIFTSILGRYVRETTVDLTRTHLQRLASTSRLRLARLSDYIHTLVLTAVYYEDFRPVDIPVMQQWIRPPMFRNPNRRDGQWDTFDKILHYRDAAQTEHAKWVAQRRAEQSALGGEEMCSLVAAVLRGLKALKGLKLEAASVTACWELRSCSWHFMSTPGNNRSWPSRDEASWRGLWENALLGYRVVMAALAYAIWPDDNTDNNSFIDSLCIFQSTNMVGIPTHEVAAPLRFLLHDDESRVRTITLLSRIRSLHLQLATTTMHDALPMPRKMIRTEYFVPPRFVDSPSLDVLDPRATELADLEGVAFLLGHMSNLTSLHLGLLSTLSAPTQMVTNAAVAAAAAAAIEHAHEPPTLLRGRQTRSAAAAMARNLKIMKALRTSRAPPFFACNHPHCTDLLPLLCSTVPLARLDRLSLAGLHVAGPAVVSMVSAASPALRHVALRNVFLLAPPRASAPATTTSSESSAALSGGGDYSLSSWSAVLRRLPRVAPNLASLRLSSLRLSSDLSPDPAAPPPRGGGQQQLLRQGQGHAVARPAWLRRVACLHSRVVADAVVARRIVLPEEARPALLAAAAAVDALRGEWPCREWATEPESQHSRTVLRQEMEEWMREEKEGTGCDLGHEMEMVGWQTERLMEDAVKELGPPGASLDAYERWNSRTGRPQ